MRESVDDTTANLDSLDFAVNTISSDFQKKILELSEDRQTLRGRICVLERENEGHIAKLRKCDETRAQQKHDMEAFLKKHLAAMN